MVTFWNNRKIKLPYTYFKLLFVGVTLLQHDDLSLDLCKREPNEILFTHAFLLWKLTNRMVRKVFVSKKQYAVLVGIQLADVFGTAKSTVWPTHLVVAFLNNTLSHQCILVELFYLVTYCCNIYPIHV